MILNLVSYYAVAGGYGDDERWIMNMKYLSKVMMWLVNNSVDIILMVMLELQEI